MFTLARSRLVFTALAVGGALGVSGCAVDLPAGTGPTTTMDAGIASSPAAGIAPLGEANRDMKTLRPEEPAQLLVTEVRTGSHSGFDRVVFEMTGTGEPGWFIDYTDSPSQQGSGRPLPHGGDVALNVNIDGTAYPFELGVADPGLTTISGSGNVVDVTNGGTFEGRSQFVIGLNTAVPYSVQVLHDPHRLVIDLVR